MSDFIRTVSTHHTLVQMSTNSANLSRDVKYNSCKNSCIEMNILQEQSISFDISVMCFVLHSMGQHILELWDSTFLNTHLESFNVQIRKFSY